MQYAYPCNLIPDREEGEGFIVTFPDVPGAITGAQTREESLFLAEDALVAMLAVYVQQQREIPTPSPVADGQELVAVPPIAAAKLALYTAMREQGITGDALATPSKPERFGHPQVARPGLLLSYQSDHESTPKCRA